MALSAEMQAFEAALAKWDNKAVRNLLNAHPELVQEHSKNHEGRFVTALNLAMDAGNLSVVDRLLFTGARMDLPIGTPPDRLNGQTAMTYALTYDFKCKKDSKAILACMAGYHTFRQETSKQGPPPEPAAFEKLQAKVGAVWDKVTAGAGKFLRSDYLIPSAIDGTAAGVAMSVAAYGAGLMQSGNALNMAGGVVAGGAAMAAGWYAATKKAENDFTEAQQPQPLSVRQNLAVAEFDKIAQHLQETAVEEESNEQTDAPGMA